MPFKDMGYADADRLAEYVEKYSGSFCWNCRHFDEFGSLKYDIVYFEDTEQRWTVPRWGGYCRRHAPRPDCSSRFDAENDLSTEWPEVEGNDWCGEHAPAGILETEHRATGGPVLSKEAGDESG